MTDLEIRCPLTDRKCSRPECRLRLTQRLYEDEQPSGCIAVAWVDEADCGALREREGAP